MQQNQETVATPCPNCQADGTRRTWRTVTYVKVFSDAHKLNGSEIMALVCANCGYIQLFTSPQDFTTGKA